MSCYDTKQLPPSAILSLRKNWENIGFLGFEFICAYISKNNTKAGSFNQKNALTISLKFPRPPLF